ncbi:glycosyltransferase family 2 protein [Aurantiacibacter poecillastricola]|uniref:glycosyltransferase family 2 protein n=1 Tax=Aurantiacibacter poecillastricola TaxID=3064385 RepID=UPI00273E7C28|nr:glycosyltransferase family 2 protein [Aurantiacibacter sp. 219JJ12-13]MDP5260012.1 glycosyltransferase family 2 protein [Aurantiacibacter sp. 219JJ12-13]
MPHTSIIIPAYNSENSVGPAIESSLAQTRPPLEIIVVDDGSTDDTGKVIASFGDKVVHLTQQNAGQGAARNAGLKVAKGKFVAFLDADDYWLPTFLERMEDFLDAHPQAVAANCAFKAERAKGDYYGPAHHAELLAEHPDGFLLDNFFDFWGEYDHVRTGTVLFRRSVMDEIGLQNADLRISQDLEYWAMIATCGRWGLLPEVLWVSNSDRFGRQYGWRRKYAARRKRTPTISAWEARVLPRLAPEDRPGFARSRGRVAAGYMMAHALGGSPSHAKELLDAYGDDMPDGTSIRILKAARRLGTPGWLLATEALRVIDRLK